MDYFFVLIRYHTLGLFEKKARFIAMGYLAFYDSLILNGFIFLADQLNVIQCVSIHGSIAIHATPDNPNMYANRGFAHHLCSSVISH